jgi:DNA-binding transcriptional MocR family regulator
MSLRRREQLVKLARKYDALIICDDVYDFLQWPLHGKPTTERPPEMRLPRLCDIDRAMGLAKNDSEGFGHAISNGSFSKLVGPGIRTGWVEATPKFVIGLGRTGATLSGGAPSQLSAAILGELLGTGELQAYVEETVRPELQKRHRTMMAAIHEHVIPAGVELRESSLAGAATYGGYFVWLTPKNGLPSKLVADQAIEEENLVIGYGNMFEVHGDEKSQGFGKDIRLCFSWEDAQDITEGVKRLGSLLGRMNENRAYYEELPQKGHDDSFVDSYK